MVNYRIGSLEIALQFFCHLALVNYRIGSLESRDRSRLARLAVNYRIGSLESVLQLLVEASQAN